MKKVLKLMALICICLIMASCTGKEEKSPMETTQPVEETVATQATEYIAETEVAETISAVDETVNEVPEIETVNTEATEPVKEEKPAEETVKPTEPKAENETPAEAVPSGGIQADAEFGSPGLDD